MCETVPGDVLVGFPRNDPAGSGAMSLVRDIVSGIRETREAQLAEVPVGVNSLDDLLRDRDIDPSVLGVEYHRITVPTEYEDPVREWIGGAYRRQVWEQRDFYAFDLHARRLAEPWTMSFDVADMGPTPSFLATSNARISAASESGGGPVYAMNEEMHAAYLSMVGCDSTPSSSLEDVTVAIIDSGIGEPVASQLGSDRLVGEVDFVEDGLGAPDGNGHGSVMAQIVADGAPGCRIMPIRVLDDLGHGSEWELVAGLAAAFSSGADVVNLSLATGLGGAQVCPHCGRRRSNVRAQVFQHTIEFAPANSEAVVLAAAGNGGSFDLSFPARFKTVVAVAGIASDLQLGDYSNRGTFAWQDAEHHRLAAAPGGEGPPDGSKGPVTEWVATYPGTDRRVYGTSPATAYASAVAARQVAQGQPSSAAIHAMLNGTSTPVGPNGSFHCVRA